MKLSQDPVSAVPALTTERLKLRAFKPADAPDVFEYSSNPRIGHDAGWPVHQSIEDSLAFITEIASQSLASRLRGCAEWLNALLKGYGKILSAIHY